MSISQSYKVFIGGSVLFIANEVENQPVFNRKLTDLEPSDWLNIIEELEEGSQYIHVAGNTAQNWDSFCSHYRVVRAAGGLVLNQSEEWLFIHRNGMWDLPKGKLEKGESIEKCAVREVAEECGIEEPTIIKPLKTTYHTYTLNGQRILKPTHWYLMKTADESELIPQTEEGISEVKWVSKVEAQKLASTSFGSIRQVVEEGLLPN
jgi:8-oxo-dGTP pyrophosphatase MutT (NUDIX family)